MNPGQLLAGAAFLASLVAGLAWLAALGGRAEAERPARVAFLIQWLALLAGLAVLWTILFSHDYRCQYAASHSLRSMRCHLVSAALWGGQGGILFGAFLTTLGLVLMRVKHPLTTAAMFFLNPLLKDPWW